MQILTGLCIIIKNITLTKMENKFQFSDKTGQRGVPTKSFGTSGQQVEKRYCPGQNGTSGHFTREEQVLDRTLCFCPDVEERGVDYFSANKQDKLHSVEMFSIIVS